MPAKQIPVYNWIPVGRKLIKLVAEHFVKISFFVALIVCPAAAQIIKHGTYFVAGFSKDYAVVAIDSREMLGGVANNQYCKIRPLSHNAFFFARGTTSAIDNATQAVIFDARDIAHNIYVQFGIGTTKFSALAETWAAKIISIYNTKPAEYGRGAVHDIMADGFFVGIDEEGNIGFAAQTILYRPLEYPQFKNFPQPIVFKDDLSDIPPPYAGGYFNLLGEFSNGGETPRAKEVIARFGTYPAGPDGVAARYSAYIAAVRNWSRDDGIGGDIAAVILERGKDLRWFHRPDFCPDD